jgi:hypothetical protein
MTEHNIDSAEWISEQYPGWRAWVSQTGRWWAIYEQVLTAGQVSCGCLPLLQAEDRDGLAGRIREQETLRTQHPAERLSHSRRQAGRQLRPQSSEDL